MSKKTTKQKFLEAFAIVKNPNTWTQGWFAKNAKGKNVEFSADPTAVCWCSLGAIQVVTGNDPSANIRIRSALEDVIPEKYEKSIAELNDTTSHRIVVKYWKKAGKSKGWL